MDPNEGQEPTLPSTEQVGLTLFELVYVLMDSTLCEQDS